MDLEVINPLGISLHDEYENLILLCRNHHKIIDDNPENYSVENLIELKKTFIINYLM